MLPRHRGGVREFQAAEPARANPSSVRDHSMWKRESRLERLVEQNGEVGPGTGWKAAGQICWFPSPEVGPPGVSSCPYPQWLGQDYFAHTMCGALSARAPQFGPSTSLICGKPWCLPALSLKTSCLGEQAGLLLRGEENRSSRQHRVSELEHALSP